MKQRLSGIPDLLGLEKELSSEYQAQLDTARHYLDTFRPKLALELLQSLKDRIWDKASLLDRYRLITYMGFAYMYQEQNVRAAQMFLDAYTLNRDSTKALANAALGYLLKEEPDRALELAREAIRRDPTIVQAYSTLVWASPGEKRFESVVNCIPVAYQQTAEVAMALGNVAQRKGLLEEAEKWFRLAIHVDTEKWPEPRGSLATLLLAKASDKYLAPQTPGIIDPHRDLVEEALELLDYAWECVADTEIRSNRLEWLASRAIARARLGYQDGAAQDLDAALREKPDDRELLRNRASLAYHRGNFAKAATWLRHLLALDVDKEDRDAQFWLCLALFEDGKLVESDAVLRDLRRDLPYSSPLYLETVYLLVTVQLQRNDVAGARSVLDALPPELSNEIDVMVLAAQVTMLEGNRSHAEAMLLEIQHMLSPETDWVTRYRLADTLQ